MLSPIANLIVALPLLTQGRHSAPFDAVSLYSGQAMENRVPKGELATLSLGD